MLHEHCSKCGKSYTYGKAFCPHCGNNNYDLGGAANFMYLGMVLGTMILISALPATQESLERAKILMWGGLITIGLSFAVAHLDKNLYKTALALTLSPLLIMLVILGVSGFHNSMSEVQTLSGGNCSIVIESLEEDFNQELMDMCFDSFELPEEYEFEFDEMGLPRILVTGDGFYKDRYEIRSYRLFYHHSLVFEYNGSYEKSKIWGSREIVRYHSPSSRERFLYMSEGEQGIVVSEFWYSGWNLYSDWFYKDN